MLDSWCLTVRSQYRNRCLMLENQPMKEKKMKEKKKKKMMMMVMCLILGI